MRVYYYAQGIVRLLRQSDAQLFAGWSSYPSIADLEILEKISFLADKATTLIKVFSKSIFTFAGFIDTFCRRTSSREQGM